MALWLFQSLVASAQVGSITRSDSIDILHTRIELDLTQVGTGVIAAKTTLRFTPKVTGITTLPLDLLQLQVDSVRKNGMPLSFAQGGQVFLVDLGGSFSSADTLEVDIFYHGDPPTDPGTSGFGGFYTTSAYQYDIGVALNDMPHSYGRSWFPCFDNFVERCTFEFIVRTSADRTVFANGSLISETDLGGGELLTHWSLAEAIPSYLASVASTNYVAVHDTLTSMTGATIPVTLVAKPADTTAMKGTFIHLPNAFHTLENWFGPYRWERVGFVLTPVGAMEHATNICFPVSTVDGTVTDEARIAHELAHHWFGDLITCSRAEEMYINEGFAEYGSYLFFEALHGRADYDARIRANHHKMIGRAHLTDGGWFALADVPQSVTYGDHSYYKGTDVWRTLRGYLGDSLFSLGFKRVLANDAFSDMSTAELRDSLTAATGIDLAHFFSDWTLQPGWAAFEVDSITSVQNGDLWPTTVFVQQKLDHADHFYEQVPVTISFESATGERWTDPSPVLLGGEFQTITSAPPFAPVQAFINADQRLALATTVQEDTLTQTATVTFNLADITLVVNAIPSPAPLRIEEFWVAADDYTAEPFAFVVSPDRWWRITGQLPPGAEVNARITVDGRPASLTSFDPGLVQNSGNTVFMEDSLVLLYRPNAHFPWAMLAGTQISFLGGNHADGYARLTTTNIGTGDLTVGWRKSATGIHDHGDALTGWHFFPNPTDDLVTIEAPRAARNQGAHLLVQDVQGRMLADRPLTGAHTRIDLRSLSAGNVFLTAIIPGEGTVALGHLVIAR